MVAILYLVDPFVPHMIFNKQVNFQSKAQCENFIQSNKEYLRTSIFKEYGHMKIESFTVSCLDEESHEYYINLYKDRDDLEV
jgi:hypothetical protein|tara:strand:+ start:1663 stop:1908 length:246 start_codon:yes stop_codon:yes gene_type:complete